MSIVSVSTLIEQCNSAKKPYNCCGNMGDSIALTTQDDVTLFVQNLPKGCNCFRGKIDISGSETLDLSPLDFLRGVGELDLRQLSMIKKLEGFKNLDTVYRELSISSSNIEEIDAFHQLKYTGTYVFISGMTQLKKISGFGRLNKCKNLVISSNPLLKDIPTFPNLHLISHSLTITDNDALNIIESFPSLDSVLIILKISENDKLTSINGFNKLVSEGNLSIYDNQDLKELSGFASLKNANTISVKDHPALQTIRAFKAVENIGQNGLFINNNTVLESITGFTDLQKINRRLEIKNNPLLFTCCFLHNPLSQNLNSITYEIMGNASGCLSKEDILQAGVCK